MNTRPVRSTSKQVLLEVLLGLWVYVYLKECLKEEVAKPAKSFSDQMTREFLIRKTRKKKDKNYGQSISSSIDTRLTRWFPFIHYWPQLNSRWQLGTCLHLRLRELKNAKTVDSKTNKGNEQTDFIADICAMVSSLLRIFHFGSLFEQSHTSSTSGFSESSKNKIWVRCQDRSWYHDCWL